jgi:hypothetical protein
MVVVTLLKVLSLNVDFQIAECQIADCYNVKLLYLHCCQNDISFVVFMYLGIHKLPNRQIVEL